MKKKEILLIAALIIFGFVYHFFESGEIAFIKSGNENSKKIIDRNHPNFFTNDLVFSESILSLKIINPAGEISVEPSIDKRTTVEITSVIYHKDKKKIEELKSQYSLKKTEVSGKGIIEVIKGENTFPYKRVRINFKIRIPKEIEIKLYNRFGNIVIKGTGKNIYIDEKFGDIQIEDIESKLKILSLHGNINLSNIKGDINLITKLTKTEIEGAGNIECKANLATLIISDIPQSKKIDINGEHTKMIFSGINSEQIRIGNSHQLVRIENSKAESITITARNCRIISDTINVNELIVKNSQNRVRLEKISGKDISVLLKHGNLVISPDRNIENINILNSYSNIKVNLPREIDPGFNLSTKYGEIVNNTKFDFNTIKERYKLTLTRTGTIPQIVINNSYGKIILETEKEEPQDQ
ncbi:MAG: DUF4097 family beta strand repeat-containing protein [Acidobacteriota bacterium]